MKRFYLTVFLSVATLLGGCASTPDRLDLRDVDLYTEGRQPTRPFRQIGILGDNARLDEEADVVAKFLKQAQRMGGDGLIVTKVAEGSELTISGLVNSYAWRGSVVVYE